MCIIFVIIITNYIIFLMIEKYTTVEEKQYEEEMIQREILYRNEYYQDMERYQEQIQDIRLAEEIIYSANPVVNAILKVKKRKGKRERDTDAGYNAAPPESIRGYRGHGCSVWESSG